MFFLVKVPKKSIFSEFFPLYIPTNRPTGQSMVILSPKEPIWHDCTPFLIRPYFWSLFPSHFQPKLVHWPTRCTVCSQAALDQYFSPTFVLHITVKWGSRAVAWQQTQFRFFPSIQYSLPAVIDMCCYSFPVFAIIFQKLFPSAVTSTPVMMSKCQRGEWHFLKT